MRVRFWGTRGSIAKPGPDTARYGGNTSCLEVRSSQGTLIIIDCGTGAHALGQALTAASAKAARGHILISHMHWDHIQGIPFFAPLFVPGSRWDIYGPKGLDQSMREALAGQMQYTYFPITPEQFAASIRYHDLVEGTFEIGDVQISTRYLNHTALTLGYRLEAGGVAVTYCSDHEPYSRTLASGDGEISGQDLQHAEFINGTDFLIHDAQYTASEYPAKIGWGHSTAEYAVKLAHHAKVKTLALTHHDPLRSDKDLDRMLVDIRSRLAGLSSPLQVIAATEGETIDVGPSQARTAPRPAPQFSATASVEPALAERSVLLRVVDPGTAQILCEAIRAEGIRPISFSEVEEACDLLNSERPSLVILEHARGRTDGLALCRAIRKIADDELQIVVVSDQESPEGGAETGVSDWLIKPITNSYARTRIRAWVLRTECRWIRAGIPHNEASRVAALRRLNILDTEPEEKFDRISRLAVALFDMPMALITLIDENRQWFKSRLGLNAAETPRDAAICAHVVYEREPMIVPDTFEDGRFADLPMVVNEPRIRFYAGYPLILNDGHCIGTLCLLDTRPRSLAKRDLDRLRDLADITLREMQTS